MAFYLVKCNMCTLTTDKKVCFSFVLLTPIPKIFVGIHKESVVLFRRNRNWLTKKTVYCEVLSLHKEPQNCWQQERETN